MATEVRQLMDTENYVCYNIRGHRSHEEVFLLGACSEADCEYLIDEKKGGVFMAGFDSVVGNKQIKEHFEKAIQLNKISHGYILNGEDGMGKMELAKSFAQMVQCESTGEKPCMNCHSCKQFLSGNHPDIIYVRHEKPGVIGVDDVRTGINSDILIKPYSSPYKIYIVDEAEKMSVQAQNALLKTIEEPPSYGIIMLLTSNAEGFLPTILSRCIVLNLKPVSDEEMEAYLNQQNIPSDRIPTLVKFSRGNVGKAMRMAQSESFTAMIDQIMTVLKRADQMNIHELLGFITILTGYKLEIKDCLDFMQMWYRDVLMLKATNDLNLLIFKEEYAAIREVGNKKSYETIEKIIQAIDTAKRRLDANVNFELTMEILLLAMKEK